MPSNICIFSQNISESINSINFTTDCKYCSIDTHIYIYIEYVLINNIITTNVQQYINHPSPKIRHMAVIYQIKHFSINDLPIKMYQDPYYKIRLCFMDLIDFDVLLEWLEDTNEYVLVRVLDKIIKEYIGFTYLYNENIQDLAINCNLGENDISYQQLKALCRKVTKYMVSQNVEIRKKSAILLSLFHNLKLTHIKCIFSKNINGKISGVIVYGLEDESFVVRRNTIISLYIIYMLNIEVYYRKYERRKKKSEQPNNINNKNIDKSKDAELPAQDDIPEVENRKKPNFLSMISEENFSMLTKDDILKAKSYYKKCRAVEHSKNNKFSKRALKRINKKVREYVTLLINKKDQSEQKRKTKKKKIKKIISKILEYFVNTMNDENELVRSTAIMIFQKISTIRKFNLASDLVKQITYNLKDQNTPEMIKVYLMSILTNIKYSTGTDLEYILNILCGNIDSSTLIIVGYRILKNNIELVYKDLYRYSEILEQEKELIDKSFIVKILISYVVYEKYKCKITRNIKKYFLYIDIVLKRNKEVQEIARSNKKSIQLLKDNLIKTLEGQSANNMFSISGSVPDYHHFACDLYNYITRNKNHIGEYSGVDISNDLLNNYEDLKNFIRTLDFTKIKKIN